MAGGVRIDSFSDQCCVKALTKQEKCDDLYLNQNNFVFYLYFQNYRHPIDSISDQTMYREMIIGRFEKYSRTVSADCILFEFPDHRRLTDAEQLGDLAGSSAAFSRINQQFSFICL